MVWKCFIAPIVGSRGSTSICGYVLNVSIPASFRPLSFRYLLGTIKYTIFKLRKTFFDSFSCLINYAAQLRDLVIGVFPFLKDFLVAQMEILFRAGLDLESIASITGRIVTRFWVLSATLGKRIQRKVYSCCVLLIL